MKLEANRLDFRTFCRSYIKLSIGYFKPLIIPIQNKTRLSGKGQIAILTLTLSDNETKRAFIQEKQPL